MADIDIRRAHQLGHAAAKAAADQMADKLGKRFGLKGDWDGDVLRFQGTGVTGTLSVGPKELHIAATLGFLLKAMKGSIQSAIEQELDRLFAHAKAQPAAAPKEKATAAKKPAAGRKTGG